MPRQVRTLRLGLEDQFAEEIRTVPFELDGERSVEVTLEHDDGAVIDLGCSGPAGWRGWSGGARRRFVIAEDAATPGYVPGPLEPGQWHVQLGLYRVPVEPIEVRVTVEAPAAGGVEPEPPGEVRDGPRASERGLPAPQGLTWFAGDFHAHSTHSDGEQSLGELAALARGNGLDFLAVTEHNTVSHHRLLPEVAARHDIVLLPGQEVTTPRGHANAFGDIGWIDFREPPASWVERVRERDGILSINHPLQDEWSWQHPLTHLPDALELWHVSWFLQPTSTAPWALLARWARDVSLLGGSDYHHPRHGYLPGTPVTWVAAADRSPEAILDGVRAGRTALTRLPSPDAPALVRVGEDLVAVAADGTVLTDLDGRSRLLRGERTVIPAGRAGTGPYRLTTPAGELLAVSP
ncbi:CehA/McbA family metallohydrolase [Georgenia deserti]|uniref:CehA/McbA family metallohydrolase n=1 Tax=Georgenia deserti TaxID=2093781 RepID=A0ABW4L203_9MICO